MMPKGPEEPAVFPTKVTAAEVRERGRLVETPRGRLALIAYGPSEAPKTGNPELPFETGKIVAIDAWCPHIDGPLWEGSARDGEVACPWHRWRFSLATGRCTWAPAGDAEEAAETEIQVFGTRINADGFLEILFPPQDGLQLGSE
ncbi:MAG: nitrite reductase/ring-hydroxylating ferredoxin subunit [Planctomycetota bacterium]|jgi:nitrite reductase/ring-hydroxylating ferredoxin subunit